MITLLNAAYGAGALLGPLTLGLVFDAQIQRPFLLGTAIALCLVPVLWAGRRPPRPPRVAVPVLSAPSHRILATFILMFVLYEGVEADIGGWEATQLTYHGYSASAAATMTALFWGGLTVGRLLTAPLSMRFRPRQLLVVCLAVLIVLLSLAHVPAITPVAYILCGVCLAAVLPLGFVWLQQVLPESAGAGSITLAGALVGAAMFPLLVGRLIALTTPDVLPTALLLLAALCFLTMMWLRAIARPERDGRVQLRRGQRVEP